MECNTITTETTFRGYPYPTAQGSSGQIVKSASSVAMYVVHFCMKLERLTLVSKFHGFSFHVKRFKVMLNDCIITFWGTSTPKPLPTCQVSNDFSYILANFHGKSMKITLPARFLRPSIHMRGFKDVLNDCICHISRRPYPKNRHQISE